MEKLILGESRAYRVRCTGSDFSQAGGPDV